MNIFKLFTQNGRRSLVAETFDQAVTVDSVTKAVANSATELLAKIKTDISVENSVKISGYVAKGNDIFKAVTLAVEDKVITQEEAARILSDILGIFGASVSDVIAAVRQAILTRVP